MTNSIINFGGAFTKTDLSIEEIAIRNAKQDNEYLVGKYFSLNHDEIEKDGGKDFTQYNERYECIEVCIDWATNGYMHKLKLDDNTSVFFRKNHFQ